MSKTTEQAISVAEATPAQNNTPAINGTFDSNLAGLLEASTVLENLEEQIILTCEPISLDAPGQSFRGIYYGTGTMTVKNNEDQLVDLPSVQFIVNKQIRMNCGVNLVKEVKRTNLQPGTPVMITFTKKEGNVKIYSISLLG